MPAQSPLEVQAAQQLHHSIDRPFGARISGVDKGLNRTHIAGVEREARRAEIAEVIAGDGTLDVGFERRFARRRIVEQRPRASGHARVLERDDRLELAGLARRVEHGLHNLDNLDHPLGVALHYLTAVEAH
jgi:hypothetical protein